MTEGTRPYLPLERRARAAIICFWVFIAASALLALGLILARSQGMNLYTEDDDLEFENAADAAAGVLVTVGGVVSVIDLLVCIIVFLMWLYRARANLPALGVSDARWSPGWAIGWWFIPIMSLFRPYQLVKEVWQASDPMTSPGWRSNAPPVFFGWWWALYLAYWTGGRFTDRYSRIAGKQPTLDTAAWLTAVDVVALAAGAAAAWCAIRIMRDITERQRQRHQVGAFS